MKTAAEASTFARPPDLSTSVVDYLGDQIISGRFRPGETLHENTVARELMVSRTPVRDAIRRLAAEGLVTLQRGRPARVALISPADVRDIYACRAVLEGLTSRLATENMTPEAMVDLRRLTAQMSQAARNDDLAAFFQANVEFHNICGQISNNQILQRLVHQLGRRVLQLRHLSLEQPGRMAISAEAHAKLLNAMEDGDGSEADVVTRDLIESAHLVLADVLPATPETGGRAASRTTG